MAMLNILNSDLWRTITHKTPEPLTEQALRELYFNMVGYVTQHNDYV